MTYNPAIHHRHSIRLKGYDYSQAGLYFITICTQNRACLFGNIENGKMILNNAGRMVESEWLKLPQRFKNIALHEFVVMPNHFHAILEIVGATLVVAQNKNGQPQGIAPTESETIIARGRTIGNLVGAFKSITTNEYIRAVKNLGWIPFDGKLWQRNYYEHIIRDEPSYLKISNYIIANPANWGMDKLK